MKRLTLFLTATMIVLSCSLSAQKKGGFKGTLKYAYTYEGAIDANMMAQFPKESEELMCGNYLKQNISGMTQLTNANDKIIYLLFDLPVGAYYIAVPNDTLVAKRKNMKYDYDYTEEHKTIAGYD